MQTVNSGMTKRVLTGILTNDYGVDAPSNATKDDLLTILKENGAVVTPDNSENDQTDSSESGTSVKKEKQYEINIFKEKDQKGAVTGCINGNAFALPRGKNIVVSKAIYEILTKGAVKKVGEPLKDGGVDWYDQAAYPLTLVRIIE